MVVIERYIDEAIFEVAVDEVKKIHQCLITRINSDGVPKWNIQLRRNNEVVLYYKGFAIKIKLYKEQSAFVLKADEKICLLARNLFNIKMPVSERGH